MKNIIYQRLCAGIIYYCYTEINVFIFNFCW